MCLDFLQYQAIHGHSALGFQDQTLFVQILAGVGVLAYNGVKKLYGWGKAKIEAKRAAEAACDCSTACSTNDQTAE